MNEEKIRQMIMRAKVNRQLHLNAQHGLDRLTAGDIGTLSQLLKRDCRDVEDLSLEDLTVTDAEAASLMELLTSLPLVSFSLQGEGVGDDCVARLCAVLRQPNHFVPKDSATACVTKDQAQAHVKPSLNALIIGGYAATDASLAALTAILATNSTLRKCSVNWSPLFSVAGALEMVKTVAETNISLIEDDFYGFFHNVDPRVAKVLQFINGFFNSIVQRNKGIANSANEPEARKHYGDFFTNYHQTLQKNFKHMQRLYELYGLNVEHFLCEPLRDEALTQLLQGCTFDRHLAHVRHADFHPILNAAPGVENLAFASMFRSRNVTVQPTTPSVPDLREKMTQPTPLPSSPLPGSSVLAPPPLVSSDTPDASNQNTGALEPVFTPPPSAVLSTSTSITPTSVGRPVLPLGEMTPLALNIPILSGSTHTFESPLPPSAVVTVTFKARLQERVSRANRRLTPSNSSEGFITSITSLVNRPIESAEALSPDLNRVRSSANTVD